MYVYAGPNRRNASIAIEGNSTLAIGAPIRIPISSGAIIILQSNNPTSTIGTATFSY